MAEEKVVLVVEDQDGERRTLCGILEDEGYKAVGVDRGEAAIEETKKRFVNIAIIDIRLPDLSGLDVLKAIREINEDTVGIVTTGYASMETAVEAMNTGAYTYIIKPFNVDAVVATLKRALEQQRLTIENRALLKELKEANKELENTLVELKATQVQLVQAGKMAAIGHLGAGIAHELNQPLTGIRGFTQLIKEHINLTESARSYFEKIELATERMAKIIHNIRLFSRESKSIFQETDVNQIIDDALMFFRVRFKEHNIEIEENLEHGLPKVIAEPIQLQQVFFNLCSNAFDAMDKIGQGKLTVSTASIENGDFIKIEFRDSGEGIPDDVLPHIFNPFFTTKAIGKGTGLGLSISHGIILDHYGTIEVESKAGQGTVFKISLPTVNLKPCWEIAEQTKCNKEDCERCPVFKGKRIHGCWQIREERHRRKDDPLPPRCKECPVYSRKTKYIP